MQGARRGIGVRRVVMQVACRPLPQVPDPGRGNVIGHGGNGSASARLGRQPHAATVIVRWREQSTNVSGRTIRFQSRRYQLAWAVSLAKQRVQLLSAGGDMLRVRRLARSRFGYEENGKARRVGTARRRLAASA